MFFDRVLSFVVVIAPTVFALVLEIVNEDIRKNPIWKYGVILFGVFLSALTWFQMSRQEAHASVAQEMAIERVTTETSERVTKVVSQQFQQASASARAAASDMAG